MSERSLFNPEGIRILDTSNGLPVLVTRSSMRIEVAKKLGLKIDDKIDVGKNEENIQNNFPNLGLPLGVTPLRIDNNFPPLPLVLAMDKALVYLSHKGRQEKSNYFCVDSAWGFRLPETLVDDLGMEEILIHKPRSVSDLIQLFLIMRNHQAKLESISGVVQYQNGQFFRRLIRVVFPPLRNDLDLEKLARIMSDNGNFAAGLSSAIVLEHPDWFFNKGDKVKIIIEDYDQILVAKNLTGEEFKRMSDLSHIPPYPKRKEENILSFDPTNYSTIIRATIGLLF